MHDANCVKEPEDRNVCGEERETKRKGLVLGVIRISLYQKQKSERQRARNFEHAFIAMSGKQINPAGH